MSESPIPSIDDIGRQVRQLVDRTIQRGVNGFDYVAGADTPVGLTPKDVVYERGTLRLYHYHPMADEIYRVPVMIVMATTNKGYLFDLAPRQSLVEYLLREGFDVFLVDWEPPAPEEHRLTLADYTQDFLPSCVRTIRHITGEPDVSVVGYCMGGVLSLIYAATHADGPLKNLACLTTPVDFQHMALTQVWQDPRYFDVDRLVDTLGVVPSEVVMQGFEMQRPAQRVAGQLRVWEQMWNDDFVKSFRAFERWSNETLPLAGEYFRETTKQLIWDNKLFNGNLVVGGERADLSNIQVPILSVCAEHDHLVPYDCAHPLMDLVGSEDREEVKMKGGHVSVIAGPNAVRRMWPKLVDWLSERSV